MQTIIGRGAESILTREGIHVVKQRLPKQYRLSVIDERLRLTRTRAEAKILEKVPFAPKVLSVDPKEGTITMEFLDGPLLRDILDTAPSSEQLRLAQAIGERVAWLHDQNIIHGDLTTSNMILKNHEVFFVDFGLSMISDRIEDKAVDVHLFHQAIESTHFRHAAKIYEEFLASYRAASKHASAVLERLQKVERRGHYKTKKP